MLDMCMCALFFLLNGLLMIFRRNDDELMNSLHD